jgi:hypothetical protein
MERADKEAEAIAALGYAPALAVRSVGVIARATDAELAELRGRIAKLEGKR